MATMAARKSCKLWHAGLCCRRQAEKKKKMLPCFRRAVTVVSIVDWGVAARKGRQRKELVTIERERTYRG